MSAAVIVLLLHPILDGSDLRLAAQGVEGAEVTWFLDGVEVGRSADRQAIVVPAPPGRHELRAESLAQGRWQAIARPEGEAQGALFVPAWTASHAPEPQSRLVGEGWPSWPSLPELLALASAALLVAPGRRGLESMRRRTSA